MDVPKLRFRACAVLLVLTAVIAFPCVVTSVLIFTFSENIGYHEEVKKKTIYLLC
jgi:hypothetical protein